MTYLILRYVHLLGHVAAIVLFTMFAVFALWLFRLTADGEQPVADKRRRNGLYLCCGIAIVVCIGWAGFNGLNGRPIFWPESIALIAFAMSWPVKGYSMNPTGASRWWPGGACASASILCRSRYGITIGRSARGTQYWKSGNSGPTSCGRPSATWPSARGAGIAPTADLMDRSGPLMIDGSVSRGFEPVRDAFIENFMRRGELGGACCIYQDGEKVVDLWGGVRDRASGEP